MEPTTKPTKKKETENRRKVINQIIRDQRKILFPRKHHNGISKRLKNTNKPYPLGALMNVNIT
jgi:hypothetical protein